MSRKENEKQEWDDEETEKCKYYRCRICKQSNATASELKKHSREELNNKRFRFEMPENRQIRLEQFDCRIQEQPRKERLRTREIRRRNQRLIRYASTLGNLFGSPMLSLSLRIYDISERLKYFNPCLESSESKDRIIDYATYHTKEDFWHHVQPSQNPRMFRKETTTEIRMTWQFGGTKLYNSHTRRRREYGNWRCSRVVRLSLLWRRLLFTRMEPSFGQRGSLWYH